jgi:transcriptional regulator with XRE-family HTH domain
MEVENYCQYYRRLAQKRQQDIAELLGVAQQQISFLEAHPLEVNVGRLLAYAQALGVAPVVLVPDLARIPPKPQEDPVCPPCPIPTVSNATGA